MDDDDYNTPAESPYGQVLEKLDRLTTVCQSVDDRSMALIKRIELQLDSLDRRITVLESKAITIPLLGVVIAMGLALYGIGLAQDARSAIHDLQRAQAASVTVEGQ